LIEAALRRAILAAAGRPALQGFDHRHGMRLGAARFVAGETIDQAVAVHRRLNEQGLRTNATLLGEGVEHRAAAGDAAATYERLLDRIAEERLDTNVALKLTHLGLSLDEELAYANVASVVGHAAGGGNFVRIDMEESRW